MTIDERAEEFGKQGCGENCVLICKEWKDKNGVCSRLASRVALYKSIATEQKAEDDKEKEEIINLASKRIVDVEASRSRLLHRREYIVKSVIDKACRCYCDNLCEKGLSGMCYHKYDGEGQVKSTFKYNECNELQVLCRTLEE